MTEVKLKKSGISKAIVFVGLILTAGALLVFPSQAVDAARGGLNMAVTVLIPSLFPFFVISSMMINTGAAENLGRILSPIVGRLLGTNAVGASACVIGLLGGDPLGVKTVVELYNGGKLDKSEAEIP